MHTHLCAIIDSLPPPLSLSDAVDLNDSNPHVQKKAPWAIGLAFMNIPDYAHSSMSRTSSHTHFLHEAP